MKRKVAEEGWIQATEPKAIIRTPLDYICFIRKLTLLITFSAYWVLPHPSGDLSAFLVPSAQLSERHSWSGGGREAGGHHVHHHDPPQLLLPRDLNPSVDLMKNWFVCLLLWQACSSLATKPSQSFKQCQFDRWQTD